MTTYNPPMKETLGTILRGIDDLIAEQKAKSKAKKAQRQAEHDRQIREFQFLKDCAKAVESAAERHGISKFELAQELKSGKVLDLALMKLDDIEMKEEILQNRIDRLNEKLKDAAINQFNQT